MGIGVVWRPAGVLRYTSVDVTISGELPRGLFGALRLVTRVGTFVLVVVPTRALAEQVHRVFSALCADLDLSVGMDVGQDGSSWDEERLSLSRAAEVRTHAGGQHIEKEDAGPLQPVLASLAHLTSKVQAS